MAGLTARDALVSPAQPGDPLVQFVTSSGNGSSAVLIDESLDVIIRKFEDQSTDVLPVITATGAPAGTVNLLSVCAALLRHSTDLQEKLRQYRKSVQKDKKRRAEFVARQEQINKAFKKLMALLARPPSPEIFQRGIEALTMLLDADYGAVVVLDSQGNTRESIMAGATPGDSAGMKTFLQHRRPLVERVLSTRKPFSHENIPQYLNSISFPLGHPTLHSFLGIPILQDEQCFGCIYLCDKKGGEPFTDDDEILAASFAQTLALVLAQAKDRVGRKRAEQERELLSEIGLRFSGADTIEKIAQSIADVTEKAFSWDLFSLYMRRSGNGAFRSIARFENKGGKRKSSSGETLDLAKVDFAKTIRAGRTAVHGSSLYAPIRMDGEVQAIVQVGGGESQSMDEPDTGLLQRLADAAGPALARCQAERRSAAFLSLAFKLTTVTTPHDAAGVIIETADELLGLDSCSITLYYPEYDVGVSVLHLDIVDDQRVEVFGPHPITKPSEVARRVMDKGPLLILRDQDPTDSSGVQRFGNVAKPSASLMYVPLRIGTHVVGVFTIQSYTPNAYNNKDLELLQALADLCAGALDRTRMELPMPIDLQNTRQITASKTPRKKEERAQTLK